MSTTQLQSTLVFGTPQLLVLSNQQFGALTTTQVDAFDVTHIAVMSTTQLAAPAVPKARSEDVRTRPLAPAIGAEILGVDLSKPMDDALFTRIQDIWHESLVILIRDQHLDGVSPPAIRP